MDFLPSDEQQLLFDSAERYIRERYGFEARRAVQFDATGFSREHWKRFGEMGWLGLAIPEAAGGLGGDMTDMSFLMEPLGAGLVVEPVIDSAVLGASLAAASDNPGLRQRLCAGAASGDLILTLAHLEEGARSEYDMIVATRAVSTAQGWRLDGRKLHVVHGAQADYWLVTARLDQSAAFGLFAVGRDTPGVEVSSYRLIDGSFAAELVFSAAPVGADALLLAPEAAAAGLEAALDRAVLAGAAWAIGSMEAVLALTADYLKQRVQYGRPLSAFQALQHRLVEMFVEADQARSALYRGLAAGPQADAAARRRAVSGAKATVAKAGSVVAGQGIQLHGGIGTTDEYAVSHHFKAMMMYEKRFGDTAFHIARAGGLRAGQGSCSLKTDI